MNPPLVAALVTTLATCVLLAADARGSRLGVCIAKPLASLGFVALACTPGIASTYDRLIVAALVACVLGDVLLIPAHERSFQVGVASFGLGHALYGAAFLARGIDLRVTVASALVLGLLAFYIWRWLAPGVPRALKASVAGYVIIISSMVALALGAAAARRDLRIALGATFFFVSDLSVARDKFMAQGFQNRLWGLPLYYAAQLLLASSAGAAS